MLKVIILNILFLLHPVHVTLITVNQDESGDAMTLFFRMYYDDFLLDYRNYYPDFNPAGVSDTLSFSNDRLCNYFNDRVKIYVNGKLLSGKITGVSSDDYEIRLNLEYKSVKNPQKFRISNKILTTIYTDQANMVYLTIGKYQDALNLTGGSFDSVVNLK